MKLGVMVGFTFREATRKRVVLLAVLLTVAFLVLYAIGSHYAIRDVDRVAQRAPQLRPLILTQWLLLGLWAVNMMSSLLAIFIASGAIGGEIEAGTFQAIVPKPVQRWEIILGKWLAYACLLAVYTVVATAGVFATVALLGDFLPARWWLSVVLVLGESLLLLSLTIFGSTFLAAVANGVIMLLLFVVGLIGGMVYQVGGLVQSETMLRIGVITSWVIPGDVFWRAATTLLQQPQPGGQFTFVGPFSTVQPPSTWLVTYAVLYAVTALFAATRIFQSRDL